ncbi:sodium-coupled monocarboxylate transporter 2-like [Oppia nitens]|uniref:sodium-coupled monocarboxylate transporter 2-like n=1 Tax=Oppia nitens TaxID=1686743 RepID=UPI0023DCAD9D|nr:sodium-coupled monocarboxylate transporter 2-like [Oppia nitens]
MSNNFGVIDYTVFIIMLMISSVIGFYYAWKDRNNTNEDEFLRGGKHMSVIPVCLSIMASFLPSTSVIGFPVTVYFTGSMFWFAVIPSILAAVLACEVFLPVYYNMNLTSVNEYLHKRFKSHKLQILGNISALLSLIPFFGVELFAPSIALSIVTDISINSSILLIGLIVTLYTSLGGLKGVIWTDVFQFSIILFGLLAIAIRGANISGGMASAFQRAHTGGRIEFWNMEFDIYSVNSFWVYILGFAVLWSGTFSTSQLQVQRAVCMPSMRSAKRALYTAIPGFIFMLSLMVIIGIVMYARYYNCDPMATGQVTRPDQLLPFFVLDIFGDDYPGLPGMFVACIFCGSLSTLSSGLNALASIIWDDYGKQVCSRWLRPSYGIYATKVLAILIGIASICFAFAVKKTDNIVEAAVMLYGSSNGPIFGLFCLGLFFPWANAYGGAAALIVGQIMSFWITIGYVSDRRSPQTLALGVSTDGCPELNNRTAPLSYLTNYKIPQYYPTGFDRLHHISPFFVPVIGFLVSLVVGNVVSLVTLGNKNRDIDKNLVCNQVCYYMEKLLPKSWRKLTEDQVTPPNEYNVVQTNIIRSLHSVKRDNNTEADDEVPHDESVNNQFRNSGDKTTKI